MKSRALKLPPSSYPDVQEDRKRRIDIKKEGFGITRDGQVTQRNEMKLRENVKAIKWLTGGSKGMVERLGNKCEVKPGTRTLGVNMEMKARD